VVDGEQRGARVPDVVDDVGPRRPRWEGDGDDISGDEAGCLEPAHVR
jgi:hypothetical protein